MQTLKNDFATVKRKGFLFHSQNLQLSISESPYHVCSDPSTAHRSTQLQAAEWMYFDVKKHRFQKAAINLACLSERSSSTDQVLLQGTASLWRAKKKRYKPLHTESSTDLSSDQVTVLPLNALQWRVCVSTAANHTLQIDANLHPWLWRKKRERIPAIPAIASFALEPTQDPTSTANSSSVVPYYTSHLFLLLTYKSFAPIY